MDVRHKTRSGAEPIHVRPRLLFVRERAILDVEDAVGEFEERGRAAERLSVYSWRIESKFQAVALASFSPMRRVFSLTKRYGGTGRLYGAGTPENTRPAGSYLEPWHGQK